VAQNRIVSNGRMVKQLEENGGKTCWPDLRHHSGIRLEEMAQIKEMKPLDTPRAAFLSPNVPNSGQKCYPLDHRFKFQDKCVIYWDNTY